MPCCERPRPQRSFGPSLEGTRGRLSIGLFGTLRTLCLSRGPRSVVLSVCPLTGRERHGSGTLPQHVDAFSVDGVMQRMLRRGAAKGSIQVAGSFTCRKALEWSGSVVSCRRKKGKRNRRASAWQACYRMDIPFRARGDKTSSPRQEQDWATVTQAAG